MSEARPPKNDRSTELKVSKGIVAVFVLAASAAAQAQTPAFPGAEGYGALATGGRGGDVIKVTTLADDRTTAPVGSLRAAIDQHNAATCFGAGPCPNTIVFEVGGTIELEAPLVVEEPALTLAGQTAPGGGIALQAKPGDPGVDGYLLEIQTSDVVVRHLRVRPGAGSAPTGTELGGIQLIGVDAHDIILDHVSVSWAEDKAITIFEGPREITVQHSILAETLGCANHDKSVGPPPPGESPCSGIYCCEALVDNGEEGVPHSRLVTISSERFDPAEPTEIPVSPTNITFHRNLLANANKRFPNVTSDTYVKFVNNVVYNFGDAGSVIHAGKHPAAHHVELDYVRNYVRSGLWTDEYRTLSGMTRYAIDVDPPPGNQTQTFKHEIYEDFNVLDVLSDEAGMTEGPPELVDWLTDWVPGTDPEPIATTMIGANTAYDRVLWRSGAFPRDGADQRIVTETDCRWGTVVDDPEAEVGGWPVLDSGTPRVDADDDGMWDDWELAQVPPLDPADPEDRNEDADGDGFTNLEEYLAERSDELVGSGQLPGFCIDVDPPSVAVFESADAISSTEVALDWYDSKDRVGLDHYDVEARVAGGAWFVAESGLLDSSASVDGLSPDEVYDLRVLAFDAVNPPSVSDPVTVQTLMVPVDNFRVQRELPTILRLRWNAHPGADSYTLYRADLEDPLVEGLTVARYDDTGLDVCTGYTYTLVAVAAGLGGGNTSEPVSAVGTTTGC